MRKINFYTSHLEFVQWIGWYGDFLKKLIEAKYIVKTKFEKRELIEALVLRCCVRWEVLVIENIITSMNWDTSKYADFLGLKLRKHLSRDECKAILIGHRYLDFKSVNDIKKFAKKYLVDKFNPFSAITKPISDKIDEFFIIRNLLSHYSDFSIRSYRAFIKKIYHFKKCPEPGMFLISITSDGSYRWSQYLVNFSKASQAMIDYIYPENKPKKLKT